MIQRRDSIMNSMARSCGICVLLLASILLLAVSPAGSVDIAGKIKGMVMDPSGAAVPGAKLTARNMATGVIAQTTSEKDGSYVFESLLPGNYEVTCVGGAGFEKFVTTNVQVISVETTAMNVTLTLGGVTQTVEVTGAATMVGTENPTLESRLGPEALDTLPILGRDPRDTAELVLPGVAPGPASRDTGTEVVNGQRGASNNYRVDGTENIDYDYGESFNYPPVEDLAEFTVLTNASDAKYGSGAGAQVDAIVKSGTNNLHASAWAYLQNEAWDANSWQGNLTGTPRPSGSQQWYGGNAGGPVYIPHLYNGRDKTFWFFSYEDTTPVGQTLVQQRVPTVAERGGDFTNSSFGIPVINGVATPTLDPSSFSVLAQNELAQQEYLPLPTLPDGTLTWLSKTNTNQRLALFKIDHSFSPKHRVFFSFDGVSSFVSYGSILAATLGTPTLPNEGTQSNGEWNQTYTGNYTWNISSHMLNSLVLGIRRLEVAQGRPKPPAFNWQTFGVNSIQLENPPDPTLMGVFVQPWGPGGFMQFGNWNSDTPESVDFVTDNFTWIKGRHTIEVGHEERHLDIKKWQNWYGAGVITYNTGQVGSTGNPIADFLLDQGGTFSEESQLNGELLYPQHETYAQDTFKVNRKLTAKFGLRWSPFFGISEPQGKISDFRPGQQSTELPHAPLGLVVPGDTGITDATIPARWGNLGPRVGLAYDVRGNGKMAIRAGYGVYYDYIPFVGFNNPLSSIPFGLDYNPPGPTSITNPYNGAQLFPFSPPLPGSQAAKNYVFPSTPVGIYSTSADYNSGRIHQWNTTFEWEPLRNYLLTVAYVGTRGTHLISSQDLNTPYFIPNESTDANQQSRRPYPAFESILENYASMNNRYNGLQINLNKKFSHSFTVQTNYTLSKATDGGDSSGAIFSSGSNRNPRDRSIDYGLSNFDHEQIFNVVYRWDIPFPSVNRALKTAFGGWRWGGITSAVSGDPLTITSPTGFDDFSANSAWANYVGGKAFGDHSTRALEADQYLNPNAFCEANAFGPGCVVDPNAGVTYLALGNSKRGMVRGPAALNFNMTLGKNFPISERLGTLRFDVEAFNLFNHTQLNDPNVDSSNLADFGKIFTANPPRRMQFAIHYVF